MSQNLVTEDEELEQKTVTEEGIKYEKYKIRLRDMRAKKLSLDGVETEPINDGETEIGAL
jgi:hypothetical protein